jgi:hypothetical protein
VKRIAALVPGFFLATLFLFTVHADQGTRVTAGALTFSEHVGDLDVSGQSNFRMQASVDTAGGIFIPENQCEDLECVPGTEVDLSARWVGSDLRGSASLRGNDYVLGSEDLDSASGDVMFSGRLTLPDFSGSPTVDVSAPFTLTGRLVPLQDSNNVELLSGFGTATLQFRQSVDGTAWQFVSATYALQKGGSTAKQ